MSALTMNSLLKNIGNYDTLTTATKAPIIDRNHYSGPSGTGYHHHHHGYHNENSGHSSQGGKNGIALTALTLLSFLFFLNILQNCLQEHMDQTNPQVIIMQARLQAAREAEAEAEKRKGETVVPLFTNSTLTNTDKELRTTSDINLSPKTNNKYQYSNNLAQIPIKLKTVEKYKIP